MPTADDTDEPQDPERLSAVQKAFRIIEAVTSAGAPASLADIERSTGLARPTLHRVTNALIAMRYVERDEQSRAITEGRRLVALALDVLRSRGPRSRRLEILRALVVETRESCHFTILSGNMVRIIDQVGAPEPLAVRYDDLLELPAHCTACGRLLLALQPPTQRAKRLAEQASLTAAQRRRLAATLDTIAVSEVGTEAGDHIAGVGGLAVPVRVADGRSIGALGLAAPAVRLGPSEHQRYLSLLRKAAAHLGAAIDDSTAP